MRYTFLFKTKDSNLSKVISNSDEDLITFRCEESIRYHPATSLEAGQCFKVENFSDQEYCLDYLKNDFVPAYYVKWEGDQNVEYILKTDGQSFYFQKVVKTQIVHRRWILLSPTSGEPEIKYPDGVEIRDYAHALYKKNEDTLYFRNLDSLKRIFPGIEMLHRDATQAEVDDFLGNSLFNTQHYDKDKIGVLNRKRIALALANNAMARARDRKGFCRLLTHYCGDIQIQNDDTVVLKTEKDLKNVLYNLDERFYTAPISKEKRLANSIIKV